MQKLFIDLFLFYFSRGIKIGMKAFAGLTFSFTLVKTLLQGILCFKSEYRSYEQASLDPVNWIKPQNMIADKYICT